MKILVKNKRAFTLAEIIIATSIFVIVIFIGITIFVNVIRSQQRITFENAIYEDGRFMMERLAREIRQSTIDMEEYYRANDPDGAKHGDQFGCYAQKFYNPGSDSAFGALCNNGDPAEPGCVINKTTLDVNTGQNPYAQPLVAQDDANAFCDEQEHGDMAGTCAMAAAFHEQTELFLINPTGNEKTFIGHKNVGGGEYAVAMIKLQGKDENTDGVYEKWGEFGGMEPNYNGFCKAGYNCVDDLDLGDNLTAGTEAARYKGYVPLTPLRTNVTSLKFYVSPLEDPRKAYAETDPAEGIQQQPHVTIVMTVRPAVSALGNFAGDVPTVTLQSTISSRVYNEVKSFRSETIDGCS